MWTVCGTRLRQQIQSQQFNKDNKYWQKQAHTQTLELTSGQNSQTSDVFNKCLFVTTYIVFCGLECLRQSSV